MKPTINLYQIFHGSRGKSIMDFTFMKRGPSSHNHNRISRIHSALDIFGNIIIDSSIISYITYFLYV